MTGAGANPRGDGDPRICDNCGDAFRNISVLAAGSEYDYCPTCMEEYMSRGREE